MGADHPKVLQPSDLQPPCVVTDARVFESDYVLGGVTVSDRNRSKLTYIDGKFDHFPTGCHFLREDGSVVEFKPGSDQEQIFLKLLKDWHAKYDEPALDARKGEFGPNEKELADRYWRHHDVERFIHALEYRCEYKKEYSGAR
jgi:hypothetical protein